MLVSQRTFDGQPQLPSKSSSEASVIGVGDTTEQVLLEPTLDLTRVDSSDPVAESVGNSDDLSFLNSSKTGLDVLELPQSFVEELV